MNLFRVLGINARDTILRNGSRMCSLTANNVSSSLVTCRKPGMRKVTGRDEFYIYRGFHTTRRQCSSIPDQGGRELPLSEQLRHMMRRLTHPVVICTSSLPGSPSSSSSSSPTSSSPRGMTMSSFVSVSLASSSSSSTVSAALPIITFNVALPSRTLDAIVHSRRFNVHVVAATAAGARLAERFTHGNANVGGGMVGVWEGLEMEGVAVRHPTDVAAAVGKNWGASGDQGESEMSAEPPMLVGDPVLAVLRCRLMTDGGDNGLVRVRNDHVMVLGEVLEILAQDAGNGDGDGVNGETVLGLAYADRRYRAPGTVIEKHVP